LLLDQVFLTEMEWRDLNPAGRALRKYAGKNLWVHFSQVNKIGINPVTAGAGKPSHTDPRGIYFFPVDWILNNAETRSNYGSSGTHISTFSFAKFPHWFVCDVDLSGPGIVLSKATDATFDILAKRGGWTDMLTAYRDMPEEESRYVVSSMHRDAKGKELWNLLKFLNRRQESTRFPGPAASWMQLLRGLTYVLDDGTGSILPQEPWQLLLLDPRRYRVIDSGKQPPQPTHTVTHEYPYWQHGIADLMAKVAETYGGTVKWKNDRRASYDRDRGPRPEANFAVGDRRFRLYVSTSGSGVSLYLHYAYGRADGDLPIRSEEMLALSLDGLLGRVQALVADITARQSDLLFKPDMSEAETIDFLGGAVGEGQPFEWKTEINNEGTRMFVQGETAFVKDKVDLSLRLSSYVSEDDVSVTATMHYFGKGMFSVSGGGYMTSHNHTTLDVMLQEMALQFKERAEHFAALFDPSRDRYGEYSPRLTEQEDVAAFRGWLALKVGLPLGGHLRTAMADDIDAYLNHTDPRNLRENIAYVLKMRRW